VAENALDVEVRETGGKGVARRLRAAGRIPGVCYGKGRGAVSISLDPGALRRVLEKSDAGMNTLIHLSVPGGGDLNGKMVLLRELQRDPVMGRFLHADFLAVDLQQTVTVSVPIHVTGKAMGVELGGILDHALRELELECLPLAIPREIVVDVSNLNVGDSLHVRDLVLPEGVTLLTDANLSVISVVAPKAEEEAPAAAEAAAAEAVPGAEGAPKPEEAEAEEKGGD
jgi:large subunit ribosomal protein L25